MAILDLGLVSKAIRQAILEAVNDSPGWTGDPDLSLLPPDKLEAGSLGIYLYHVNEDPHFKSQPPAGTGVDPVPVRHTPMGLDLYYLLCTDAKADSEAGVLSAQRLLGLAIKALHDYPVLTAETCIGDRDEPVLETAGFDDTDTRLRIQMQPVSHQEAVSYWTAGQSPLRLSAYYCVSVVMLESEPSPTRTGRVLTHGIQIFSTGAPRLTGSRSRLEVTVPGASGPREIQLRPAQVAIGGRLELLGTGLTGDDVQLVLDSPRWDEPLTAGLTWGVVATGERLIATVADGIEDEPILPGLYSAKVRVLEHRVMPDGHIRTFSRTSNATPFAITPRIDTIGVPDADGVLTLIGLRFADPGITGEDLALYLGPDLLPVGTAGALAAGSWAVVDETEIELRLPADLGSGPVPVRLIIRGAESAPAWVFVP